LLKIEDYIIATRAYATESLLAKRSGLPDDIFSNQNLNLEKILRALDWKSLVYSFAIWNILLLFCTCNGHLVAIWYSFPRFGILYQEKSGIPGKDCDRKVSEMLSFILSISMSERICVWAEIRNE
jgi:hypothetical protein